MASYVDVLGGLDDTTGYKAPCRLATTADLGTALIGLLIIDGVQTVAGDRILVWQQADQTTNGIYTTSTGAWARSLDFSSSSSILKGTQLFVSDGAQYAGVAFECQVSNPSVGTTAITFVAVNPLASASFGNLPTVLPTTPGKLWNDGGSISIS